jgi:hypothetical protein
MNNVLYLCLSGLTWDEAYLLGVMSRNGLIAVSAGSRDQLKVHLLSVSPKYFYRYLSGKRPIDGPVVLKRSEERVRQLSVSFNW